MSGNEKGRSPKNTRNVPDGRTAISTQACFGYDRRTPLHPHSDCCCGLPEELAKEPYPTSESPRATPVDHRRLQPTRPKPTGTQTGSCCSRMPYSLNNPFPIFFNEASSSLAVTDDIVLTCSCLARKLCPLLVSGMSGRNTTVAPPVRAASYIFRNRKSHCPMYCVSLCVR